MPLRRWLPGRDLALDLGTTNSLIHRQGRGVVLDEPSVVAVDSATGEVVTAGESVVRIPYERSPQRFASLRAARDAQIRAAKTLADLIRNRIAADLTAS